MAERPTYAFGPFLLDAAERRLLRSGRVVPVRPKVFQTLKVLVENRDRLIHKDELMAMVWPDTNVAESNLTHNLSVLRKILGQDRETQYVVTVPGRGYRFTAPVKTPVGGSIAIRPFANMSSDPEQDFFCEGLVEEVIEALVRVDGLRVLSRTSSFDRGLTGLSAPRFGRKVGVSAILEGSVRRSGDRVRISVQLIRVADGIHLWSRHYDRVLGTISEIQIQEDIARAIARRVNVELRTPNTRRARRIPTDNQEVWRPEWG